jgi:outer membrane beta-barrel protein
MHLSLLPCRSSRSLLALALAGCAAAALPALAQAEDVAQSTTATQDSPEQVIVPQVERRQVVLPKFSSNDFSFSLFGGSYTAQNFGSNAVVGLRLGYHITEDVFVEGSIGRSKVTDQSFRQVLPGGIFPSPTQTLSYYDVVAGYNLLPGEVFFGRHNARATQGYVVAGLGTTNFAGEQRQTLVVGFGYSLVLSDHFAIQADVRDHLFSLDLLGKNQSTQNPEITLAATAFF